MIKVLVQQAEKLPFKHQKLFEKIAKSTLELLEIKEESEINVIVIDNKEMAEISKKYKQKNKATDVLSFPAAWKELVEFIGYNMLGDIYISYEKIATQAKEYNHSEKREWAYLFVHGLLHLCGYNHETIEEERVMNELASHIMVKVKVGRNE